VSAARFRAVAIPEALVQLLKIAGECVEETAPPFASALFTFQEKLP
jgi:hypothetical protein